VSAADRVIAGLQNVRVTGPAKWAAACPLCKSRTGRPIAVRALPDGRALVYAFCACDTADVLNAIGLKLADLFPAGPPGQCFKPERHPFDAMQVLVAIAHEITVTAMIAEDMRAVGTADDEQRERLRTAVRRLNAALDAIGDRPVPQEIRRIRRAEAATP
jgi:hypothetical protein